MARPFLVLVWLQENQGLTRADNVHMISSHLFLYPKSLSFFSLTNENIVYCLHHPDGALIGVYLSGQSNRLRIWLWLCLSPAPPIPAVPALRVVYRKVPACGNLCHLNLHCLISAGKSHSDIAYPVSQISSALTGGVSHFCGRRETLFSLHHPYHLCNKGFYFLRLIFVSKLLDWGGFIIYAPPPWMPLMCLVKPLKFRSYLSMATGGIL